MAREEFDADAWLAALGPIDEASIPQSPPDRSVVDPVFLPFTAAPDLAALAGLATTDFDAMTELGRVRSLAQIEAAVGCARAIQARIMASSARHDRSVKRWSVDEIAAALRVPFKTGQTRVRYAEQLCNYLPRTWQALFTGVIGEAQATAIVDQSFSLDPALLPEFEQQALQNAAHQSARQVRDAAGRAAIRLDPALAERLRREHRRHRSVRIAPSEHGMAWLLALLPAADAQAVYERLDAAARTAPREDPRTVDELRADALVEGVLAGVTGELPTAQGRQPSVNVIVGLSTLVGQDDEPGWLDGYGAVTAQTARELSQDPTGTWRRLVVDPVSGQPLDYGSTRYRPPSALRDFVLIRDGHSRFPYSSTAAHRCQVDHRVPYPEGPTSADNLGPLNKRGHDAKTEAGWRVARDPDTGTEVWTTPLGLQHTTTPPIRWTPPDRAGPNPPIPQRPPEPDDPGIPFTGPAADPGPAGEPELPPGHPADPELPEDPPF